METTERKRIILTLSHKDRTFTGYFKDGTQAFEPMHLSEKFELNLDHLREEKESEDLVWRYDIFPHTLSVEIINLGSIRMGAVGFLTVRMKEKTWCFPLAE